VGINKERNSLVVQGLESLTKGSPDAPRYSKSVHYSNVQLYVGDYEFPSKPDSGSETPEIVPVFATRMSTTKATYMSSTRRWIWNRYAASTSPALPQAPGIAPRKNRIRVDWPKTIPRAAPTQEFEYDTPEGAVKDITYTPCPPTLAHLYPSAIPYTRPDAIAVQDAYILSLHSPSSHPYNPAVPMEQYLFRELSNPHSRAKKQQRWQARLAAREEVRDDFINTAVTNSKTQGQTRAEAKREGEFKWKVHDRQVDKLRNQERFVVRGAQERIDRREKRRARKAVRKDVALRNLILAPAPNQFIPPTQKTTS